MEPKDAGGFLHCTIAFVVKPLGHIVFGQPSIRDLTELICIVLNL